MESKRKYAKRLSQEETTKFIKSRVKLNKLFTRKTFNRDKSWRAVAADAGILMEVDAMIRKWGFLQTTYKKLIDPPTGTGTSEGELTPENWPYFEAMHEWAAERHNIHPPYLMSTEDGVANSPMPSITPSASSAASPATSSTSAGPRGNSEAVQQILERSERIERMLNKMFKGASKIFRDNFNINLDDSDSD